MEWCRTYRSNFRVITRITPAGSQGNRAAGIGVQFNDSSDGEAARTKIESMLAGILGSDKPTYTM